MTFSDADECASNPCQNGGVCSDHKETGYTCYCTKGWSGEQCTQGKPSSHSSAKALCAGAWERENQAREGRWEGRGREATLPIVPRALDFPTPRPPRARPNKASAKEREVPLKQDALRDFQTLAVKQEIIKLAPECRGIYWHLIAVFDAVGLDRPVHRQDQEFPGISR